MYDIENYYNAETIKEAVLLLKEHPDARIISGGSDVLIKIREGKMAGTSLVSIRDIKEIRGIRLMDSGDIFIGAAYHLFPCYQRPGDSEADTGPG